MNAIPWKCSDLPIRNLEHFTVTKIPYLNKILNKRSKIIPISQTKDIKSQINEVWMKLVKDIREKSKRNHIFLFCITLNCWILSIRYEMRSAYLLWNDKSTTLNNKKQDYDIAEGIYYLQCLQTELAIIEITIHFRFIFTFDK